MWLVYVLTILGGLIGMGISINSWANASLKSGEFIGGASRLLAMPTTYGFNAYIGLGIGLVGGFFIGYGIHSLVRAIRKW